MDNSNTKTAFLKKVNIAILDDKLLLQMNNTLVRTFVLIVENKNLFLLFEFMESKQSLNSVYRTFSSSNSVKTTMIIGKNNIAVYFTFNNKLFLKEAVEYINNNKIG